MKTILIGILIAFAGLANAQDYVVTQKNDTIKGKVKILTYDIIDRVEIITNEKKKEHFTCIQLSAVTLENAIYKPIRTSEGYRMMKLTHGGFLSSYLGRRKGSTLYEVPYLVKKYGESLEIPGMGFKKSLRTFLADCPSVTEKIQKDIYSRNDINKLIDDYNNCLDHQAVVKAASVEEISTNPNLPLIASLRDKINASSIETKKDAVDILNDISEKFSKNKAIPAYLLEGLKDSLKNAPEFKDEADQLIALLKSK